jgi:curved DNA-binding protein CbpA
MSFSPGDYYRRLCLPQTASRQEIKAAFRRLARQYHPDLHPNRPDAVRQFRALREAYEVLSDRIQRQRYDHYQQGYGVEKALTDPQTAADFYIRGVRYSLSRRYQAALEDYSQAIALDGQCAEAYLRRAEVRYLTEDDSGVLADCQRAIALNSTESKTYYYQGLARYRLEYVQSAIAAFTDAITCDPDEAQYYYRRGLAYQDLHLMDDAAKDLRRAAYLFRDQGNVASYQQLHQYLRQFGAAGRSQPMRFFMGLGHRLLRGFSKGDNGPDKASLQRRRASDFPLSQPSEISNVPARPSPHSSSTSALNDPNRLRSSNASLSKGPKPIPKAITPFDATTANPNIKAPNAKAPNAKSNAKSNAKATNSKRSNAKSNARNSSKNMAEQRSRWPLSNLSGQAYWAPGVSSRPGMGSRPQRLWWQVWMGVGAALSLLSNPAGEMLPLYRRLGPWQTSLVGYSLAVLANLTFVLSSLYYWRLDSWLIASRLWLAGGMTFVAMVLVVALARIVFRVRSLWVADIFMLGSAMLPLGMGIGVSAIALTLSPSFIAPANLWLVDVFTQLVALWALSHSLIAVYSGLSRIHTFSDKFSAWFSPMVLLVGFVAGLGTWGFLVR